MKILKENIKNIPTILGLLIIGGDVFSIVVSQFFAQETHSFLRETLFSDMGTSAEYNLHQNLFLILGMILTAILYHKNFYTSRIPWWSQVQYIGKIVLTWKA